MHACLCCRNGYLLPHHFVLWAGVRPWSTVCLVFLKDESGTSSSVSQWWASHFEALWSKRLQIPSLDMWREGSFLLLFPARTRGVVGQGYGFVGCWGTAVTFQSVHSETLGTLEQVKYTEHNQNGTPGLGGGAPPVVGFTVSTAFWKKLSPILTLYLLSPLVFCKWVAGFTAGGTGSPRMPYRRLCFTLAWVSCHRRLLLRNVECRVTLV